MATAKRRQPAVRFGARRVPPHPSCLIQIFVFLIAFSKFILTIMSAKKRKGDLPAISATGESDQTTSPDAKLSQPTGQADHGGDDSDESSHATTRTLLRQRDAELAAALLEIERLRAAASEPCARCNFYPDWTIRVRTMSGRVHTIACPDGPRTLVAHVKQKLALYDPKCHILQQVTLVLPCETSSSGSADATNPALADDRTLASYGISKRDVLDLFLVDMDWSNECRDMIEFIKNGGDEISFTTNMALWTDVSSLAVSWALVNEV